MAEKHAAAAASLLVRDNISDREVVLKEAHVEAMLAVAEQARIANLIALHDLRFRGYLQGYLELPPITQPKSNSSTDADELRFTIKEALA